MNLKTGYGYFVEKDGRKLKKFELPIGDHPDNNQGYKVVEVADKAALDAIVLDKSDQQLAWEKKQESKKAVRKSVQEKLRKVANFTDEELAAIGLS